MSDITDDSELGATKHFSKDIMERKSFENLKLLGSQNV